MKKRDAEDEILLHRIRTTRNARRAELAKRRAKARQARIDQHAARPTRPKGVAGRILVPFTGQLALNNPTAYDSTLELVSVIRRHVLKMGRRVIVDLRNCEYVHAAAALKLHAEIEVLDAARPHRKPNVSVWLPTTRKPRQFLTRVRFCQPNRDDLDDVAGILPLQSHTRGGDALPALLKNMNCSLYNGKAVATDAEWQALSTAINEAMLNVNHHAYTRELPSKQKVVWEQRQDFVKQMGRRWWVLGETHGDQLFLAIFDKGVGIPTALTSKDSSIFKALTRLAGMAAKRLNGGHDSGLVKAAMALGKSGTKKAGRGYGLDEILKFVVQNPLGTLIVMSNRGIYQYESETKKESLYEKNKSMHGTLIQWNVSLAPRIKAA